MRPGAVADIARPAVIRVAFGEPSHQRVPQGLGHDGGGGDLRHQSVAADDGPAGEGEAGHRIAPIDPDRFREFEGQNCPAHGVEGRAAHVEPVHQGAGPGRHGDAGVASDQGRQLLALGGLQALAVVEAGEQVGRKGHRPEPDRRHDHGAAEGAASDLVAADHRRVTLRQMRVERRHRAEIRGRGARASVACPARAVHALRTPGPQPSSTSPAVSAPEPRTRIGTVPWARAMLS